MSVPVITFFNNKGGVGKTSLVYHISWMLSSMGKRVIAADLDPQSNLTAAFLEESELEEIFSVENQDKTIFGCLHPLIRGVGDISQPRLKKINENLNLVLGDMALSSFEDYLSETWPKCLEGDERSFRVTSAFWRLLQKAAADENADYIIIDLGPNLGAINRSALIASDYFVIPLSPDLFSLQGLKNLGPALRRWRQQWNDRLQRNPSEMLDMDLPLGKIVSLGYILMRYAVRLDRPVKAYERWVNRIPQQYAQSVLNPAEANPSRPDEDSNCIGKLRDFRSLMPLALEARKPIFMLKPADGAIGAHANAVTSASEDFRHIVTEITARILKSNASA